MADVRDTASSYEVGSINLARVRAERKASFRRAFIVFGGGFPNTFLPTVASAIGVSRRNVHVGISRGASLVQLPGPDLSGWHIRLQREAWLFGWSSMESYQR